MDVREADHGDVGLRFLTGSVAAAEPARKPNVVFILADDLGYTDVGCFGSKYYETPNIDRMAAQGMRFTNGYTCGPNCQPTRAALMSGQYGPRTGIYTVGSIERFDWKSRPLRPVDNVESLPLEKVTLAQALKKAGYATGLFGKWHLGQQGAYTPPAAGSTRRSSRWAGTSTSRPVPRPMYPPGTYLADFLTDKAVDFIDPAQGRARSSSACTISAVHAPHEAKKELIAKFKDKPPAGGHHDPTYAAMIASVDESVGRVLKTLDDLGLAEKTLVIFTDETAGSAATPARGSEGRGNHRQRPAARRQRDALRGGHPGRRMSSAWPGKIAAGTTCDEPINSVDLYPTLLELAGGEAARDVPARRRELPARLLTGGGGEARPRGHLLALPGLPRRRAGVVADHAGRRDPRRRLEADRVLRDRQARAVQPARRSGGEDGPFHGEPRPDGGTVRQTRRLAETRRTPRCRNPTSPSPAAIPGQILSRRKGRKHQKGRARSKRPLSIDARMSADTSGSHRIYARPDRSVIHKRFLFRNAFRNFPRGS